VEARTLGKRRAGALNAARRRLLPRRFVDAALRAGPWGLKHGRRLTLRKVRQHPHGLDLGALHPVLPRRLLTKDKRIRLDHPVVVADWPRLMAALHADGDDSLLLIGRRHLRSNNSWMHNSQRLTRGTNHCAVLVHPDDAAARGIAEGDRVSITTPAGSIEAVAEISESVMAGVVCMPHGWGHASRDGVGWSHAASLPGSSVNDITEDTRFDPLSGNAAVTALPVDVTVAR
ncbi:MAG: molybdopterin dinucleotide binding domain-containing protein, partial [Candidatus Nanopelagicales bacterium]